ncbi:helix-turn-helix domain-containing protein [Providencia alcalifaciens]|uniref:helix-turn-helix domain-containing protein n=1 Tax=Providencia alcalifaciens TaxID=126385 RepID=UPI00029BF948|nr:helix-turn-helix domain-containing protein [Providencia alcalifaciens]EKT64478.1 DNA-binding protein [Providencia alcalifaciens Dmel2]
MSHYAYFRTVKNSQYSVQGLEQSARDILQENEDIISQVIIEEQLITEITKLPKNLMKYINNIFKPNDTLLIDSLINLGNNTQQIAYIVQRCQSIGMTIALIDEPHGNILMNTVRLAELFYQINNIEDNYEKLKLERRHLIALNRQKQLGRPEGSIYSEAIYRMRQKGFKQREVAKQFNISLSTVKRYWNKRLFEKTPNSRVVIY